MIEKTSTELATENTDRSQVVENGGPDRTRICDLYRVKVDGINNLETGAVQTQILSSRETSPKIAKVDTSSHVSRLIPLASSSAGNCTAICAAGKVYIVDAGISRVEMICRLQELGILSAAKPAPDVLLLTHEHGDHAKYAHQWERCSAPIYCTLGTAVRLKLKKYRRVMPWAPVDLDPHQTVATCIGVPHDAAEPVAWRVWSRGRFTAIVATDLGGLPPGFDTFCTDASDVLIEANYHRRMLEASECPAPLKQRIGGPDGHLSVHETCGWIKDRMPATVKRLWLGHVSTVHCTPQIVWGLAKKALAGREVELTVLER